MAAWASASVALRQIMANLASRATPFLPGRFSASSAAWAPIQQATVVPTITYSANISARAPVRRTIARKATAKVGRISNASIQTRSLTIASPLHINQSQPIFMSFSRRQWIFFGGGLFVLGVGTVQYMELNAVKKFLGEASETSLTSATLGYEMFRTAGLFSSTLSRSIVARNETIISLACKSLKNPNVPVDVKAAATWFLSELWADEDSHPVVLKHLDTAKLCRQFVAEYQEREYVQSTSLLLATAFATRPPSEDPEGFKLAQREAIARALPLTTLRLLGQIAVHPSTHSDIVASTAIPTTLQAMKDEHEVRIGTELLYHLSSSETGRQALLNHDVVPVIDAAIFDSRGSLYTLYHENNLANLSLIHLTAMFANLYRSNLADLHKKYPNGLSGLSPDQIKRVEQSTFEMMRMKQESQFYLSAGTLSVFAALIWSPIRGIARNWYRQYHMPLTKTVVTAAWRSAIGAPLLLAGALAAFEAKKKLKDDRLFITWAVVGSSAILMSARLILAFAPFSALPALLGGYAILSPPSAEKAAHQALVLQFNSKTPSAESSIMDELEDQQK